MHCIQPTLMHSLELLSAKQFLVNPYWVLKLAPSWVRTRLTSRTYIVTYLPLYSSNIILNVFSSRAFQIQNKNECFTFFICFLCTCVWKKSLCLLVGNKSSTWNKFYLNIWRWGRDFTIHYYFHVSSLRFSL